MRYVAARRHAGLHHHIMSSFHRLIAFAHVRAKRLYYSFPVIETRICATMCFSSTMTRRVLIDVEVVPILSKTCISCSCYVICILVIPRIIIYFSNHIVFEECCAAHSCQARICKTFPSCRLLGEAIGNGARFEGKQLHLLSIKAVCIGSQYYHICNDGMMNNIIHRQSAHIEIA